MPDTIKILYGGVDAFGPQPTPLVGLDDTTLYFGERWGVRENMTLNGQLTGCTFDNIVSAQQNLLNKFNQSFQTIEIWQFTGLLSGLIYQKDITEINSIQFSSNEWVGVMPYVISLSCYPSGLFSGAFGILNPQDSWSYQEQQNEVLNATHTISCQPFNTSSGPSNALTNAKTWAFARTGISSAVNPLFISGVDTSRFCLITQSENIDRFNGIYTLVENYTNDLARTGYGVIRYTTTVESGANIISVNLQGRAEGCGRNITGLRYAFNNLDKLSIATNAYQSVFGRTDLNPLPISRSFSEDPFTTTIDFNYSYDNSNLPSIWFDYTVDLSVGTNGLITASIQGIIQARGGDLADKLARCKTYAASIDLYNLVLPFYNTFDTSSSAPLNPVPTSNGQTNNESNGTVLLNATFDNKTKVDSILDRFDYVIDIVPSLAKVDAKPVLDGLGRYSVLDLNYGSRATVSINGTAVVNRNFSSSVGVSSVKQRATSLFFQYGSLSRATLDQDIVTQSRTDNKVLSFSFVWSCGPNNVVGPTTISSLRV